MLWEQPQIPEKVNLKVDWERLGKTFKQVLTVGMAMVANYRGRGTWYPGKIIVKVNDDSTYHIAYDDRRSEDCVSAGNVRIGLSTATSKKCVYLQKKKNLPRSMKGKKWTSDFEMFLLQIRK